MKLKSKHVKLNWFKCNLEHTCSRSAIMTIMMTKECGNFHECLTKHDILLNIHFFFVVFCWAVARCEYCYTSDFDQKKKLQKPNKNKRSKYENAVDNRQKNNKHKMTQFSAVTFREWKKKHVSKNTFGATDLRCITMCIWIEWFKWFRTHTLKRVHPQFFLSKHVYQIA